jgi:hypothetical protein
MKMKTEENWKNRRTWGKMMENGMIVGGERGGKY